MRGDVCQAYMTRRLAWFSDLSGHRVPKQWKHRMFRRWWSSHQSASLHARGQPDVPLEQATEFLPNSHTRRAPIEGVPSAKTAYTPKTPIDSVQNMSLFQAAGRVCHNVTRPSCEENIHVGAQLSG